MRFLSIGLAGLCLMLSGCIKQYVAPTRPDRATIEFKGDLFYGGPFVFFSKGEDCSNKRAIPDEYNWNRGRAKPLPVAGGQQVAFMIFGFRGGEMCRVIVSFLPQPGAQYTALGVTNEETCAVRVLKNVGTGSRVAWEPEPSAKQREQARSLNMSNDAPFCKPLPGAKASS